MLFAVSLSSALSGWDFSDLRAGERKHRCRVVSGRKVRAPETCPTRHWILRFEEVRFPAIL